MSKEVDLKVKKLKQFADSAGAETMRVQLSFELLLLINKNKTMKYFCTQMKCALQFLRLLPVQSTKIRAEPTTKLPRIS